MRPNVLLMQLDQTYALSMHYFRINGFGFTVGLDLGSGMRNAYLRTSTFVRYSRPPMDIDRSLPMNVHRYYMAIHELAMMD